MLVSKVTEVTIHRGFSHDVKGGYVGGMLQMNDTETLLDDPNELLQCQVDYGFHNMAAHPAIPLHHFSFNMAAE